VKSSIDESIVALLRDIAEICLKAWDVEKSNARPTSILRLGTLDNPGWTLRASVPRKSYALLEDACAINFFREDSEDDWIGIHESKASIDSAPTEVLVLMCSAGPRNLLALVTAVRNLLLLNIEEAQRVELVNSGRDSEANSMIEQWYVSHCDEDWEHQFGTYFQLGLDWNASVEISYTYDKSRLEETCKKCIELTGHPWRVTDYSRLLLELRFTDALQAWVAVLQQSELW